MLKKYYIPRLIQYFTVVFIGLTLVFVIPRLLPSNPVESQLSRMMAQGQYLDPAAVEQIREGFRVHERDGEVREDDA